MRSVEKPETRKMTLVTVYLPEVEVGAIDSLVYHGIWSSRSEAIREALGPLIELKLKLLEDLKSVPKKPEEHRESEV